mmetsp:Transcript_23289/g.49611  ORF Transcript_23289/g.49611 Transcript_23289/m.49611 type:complete len:234 (+) Transcript_23289:51-752(+)
MILLEYLFFDLSPSRFGHFCVLLLFFFLVAVQFFRWYRHLQFLCHPCRIDVFVLPFAALAFTLFLRTIGFLFLLRVVFHFSGNLVFVFLFVFNRLLVRIALLLVAQFLYFGYVKSIHVVNVRIESSSLRNRWVKSLLLVSCECGSSEIKFRINYLDVPFLQSIIDDLFVFCDTDATSRIHHHTTGLAFVVKNIDSCQQKFFLEMRCLFDIRDSSLYLHTRISTDDTQTRTRCI